MGSGTVNWPIGTPFLERVLGGPPDAEKGHAYAAGIEGGHLERKGARQRIYRNRMQGALTARQQGRAPTVAEDPELGRKGRQRRQLFEHAADGEQAHER